MPATLKNIAWLWLLTSNSETLRVGWIFTSLEWCYLSYEWLKRAAAYAGCFKSANYIRFHDDAYVQKTLGMETAQGSGTELERRPITRGK